MEEPGTVMYNSQQFLKGIHFGFDDDNLYLRLDHVQVPEDTQPDKELSLVVTFLDIDRMLKFKWNADGKGLTNFALSECREGKNGKTIKEFTSIKAGRIVELSIPFMELGLERGVNVKFVVSLFQNGLELKRYPSKGFISLQVPDESFHLKVWSV